jgi:hypothetical protein
MDIFEYLAAHGMSMHLIRMHVRIDFKQLNELTNYSDESNEKKFASSSHHNRQQQQQQQQQQHAKQQQPQQLLYDYAASSEQTLKIRVCKSYIPMIKSGHQSNNNINNAGAAHNNNNNNNESFSTPNGFEMALADEQVFTYFINKIDQNKQCLSIVISNVIVESGGNNFSYCIELSKCDDRLPFVCKFETNKTKDREQKIASVGGVMSSSSKSGKKIIDSSNFIFPDTLQGYIQDPKMSYVMNSFLALVHGLNRVHQAVSY